LCFATKVSDEQQPIILIGTVRQRSLLQILDRGLMIRQDQPGDAGRLGRGQLFPDRESARDKAARSIPPAVDDPEKRSGH